MSVLQFIILFKIFRLRFAENVPLQKQSADVATTMLFAMEPMAKMINDYLSGTLRI